MSKNVNNISDEEEDENFLFNLSTDSEAEKENENKRIICQKCRRPLEKACLCSELPKTKYKLKNCRIIMIQHKLEMKRPMATEPIIRNVIEENDDYHLVVCKIFKKKKWPRIVSILEECPENNFVLYPAKDSLSWSVDLNEKIAYDKNHDHQPKPKTNLIIIDGTWRQAQQIYAMSDLLNTYKTCLVSQKQFKKSEYLIRTQPTENSLSTLEAVGLALLYLKEDIELYEKLLKPLRKMCQIQIEHGSQIHESKQFLIANGLMEEDRLPQNNNRKKNNIGRVGKNLFLKIF